MKHQNPRRNRRPVTASGFDLETQWQFASRWFKRALKASTILGMLIVMFYFLNLRAMPVDSLSSIGQLAGPVAFTAMLFFLLMLLYWGFPVFMAKALFIDGNWNKEKFLHWINAGIARKVNIHPAPAHSFQTYLWFALKWNFCTLVLWWLGTFSLAMPDYFFGSGWSIVFTLVCLAMSFGFLYKWFDRLNEATASVNSLNSSQTGVTRLNWMFVGIFYGAFSIIATVTLLMMAGISPWGSGDNSRTVWSWLAFVFGVALFSNSMAFANILHSHSGEQKKNKFTPILTVLIVVVPLAGMLIGLAGQALMNTVMTALSVRIPNATLQLNSAGCESVAQWGAQFDHGPIQVPSTVCALTKVVVFSRIGSYWLIGCESPHDPTDKNAKPIAPPERRRLQASFVQGIEQNIGHPLPTASYCP